MANNELVCVVHTNKKNTTIQDTVVPRLTSDSANEYGFG